MQQTEDAPGHGGSLLHSILESTADGILVVDRKGRIVASNRRFARMWRIPDVAEARDHQALVDLLRTQVKDPDAFVARVRKLQARPESESFDLIELRDGRVFERYSLPQMVDGEAVGRVVSFRDVTERSRADEALRRSEEKHRAILESLEEGYYEVDLGGRFTFVNPSLCRALGVPRFEALGRSYREFVSADSARVLHTAFRRVYATGVPEPSLDWQMRRPDGSQFHASASAALVREADARPVGFRGLAWDITERKTAEEALRESEERYRLLVELVPDAIAVHQDGRMVFANTACVELMGGESARDAAMGRPIMDFVHQDSRAAVVERLSRLAAGEAVPLLEETMVRPDGTLVPVEVAATPFLFGKRKAALVVMRDISERRRAEEKSRAVAFQDPLTGLPNRRLFDDRLSLAVAHALRQRRGLAVLFLDIDRFKAINDSLGHSVGDEVLCAVGARVAGLLRECDTVARLGGDEYVLLLPGVARPEDAAKVAEKLLDALRQPFAVCGREIFLTASAGIALCPEDAVDAEVLVRSADSAMYRAKDLGRDGYQLYTSAMNTTALERLSLETGLRRALAQNQFEVHYQPVIDLKTGAIHGVEALLRWFHPELGCVPPASFIPIAEVTGLIFPLGPWVLRTACAQVKAWEESGHGGINLSVNLSARQFQHPDLVGQITRVLGETGLAPTCLELEITETCAMQNAEASAQILRELKNLGVSISIDDFGVGYCSLGYLKRLPIDTLKIDGSFVRDIHRDPDDAAIVSAVIVLAQSLKLATVAEGVETEEQRSFLTARRCNRMQGHLFSRPLSAVDCADLLFRHRPLRTQGN